MPLASLNMVQNRFVKVEENSALSSFCLFGQLRLEALRQCETNTLTYWLFESNLELEAVSN